MWDTTPVDADSQTDKRVSSLDLAGRGDAPGGLRAPEPLEMGVVAPKLARRELRCSGCGYGAVAARALRCPMCGGERWDFVDWRPFAR